MQPNRVNTLQTAGSCLSVMTHISTNQEVTYLQRSIYAISTQQQKQEVTPDTKIILYIVNEPSSSLF